jgi:hypothetical protein
MIPRALETGGALLQSRRTVVVQQAGVEKILLLKDQVECNSLIIRRN